jgi:DNA-binding transcriptional regulator WhiA
LFSRDAKDEVAGAHFKRACCPGAFVRALQLFAKVSRHGSGPVLTVASERASVARAVIAAAHVAGVDARMPRASSHRAGRRWTVTLPAFDRGAHLLPQRVCCRRTWLRAAFLACGSVSDPSRGFHLEFFCRAERDARALSELVSSFGVDVGIARRRGRPLVYVKDAGAVSALLGHMGATRAVLRLEGQRAINQTKNLIRRTVNSEAANAARAAASAARQRNAARRAIAKLGLAHISPALSEAAQLRIAYPARTLRELARAARPPISKAAMASRLRLLERLIKR